MIKLQNISFEYDSKPVFEKLTHSFSPACIHGIVGMNGSGKSTLFNLLAKLIKPTKGELLYDDQPIRICDSGYIETSNFFYSNITGNEYLKIFSQTNAFFDLVALQTYMQLPLDEFIENYSTGMKKKLALLAILKKDYPIYIFDEPFNGLDLETNKVLEIILLALKAKGKTIFISSHILEPLLSVCDLIHHLEIGRFTKVYQQGDFGNIDQDLFGKFQEDAKKAIYQAV